MSTARETILALVEKSKATWDFEAVAAELNEAAEAVQRDGTLAEPSKRPLVNIANVALKALEERLRSPQHLQQALAGVELRIAELPDEQADQLAIWFFKIAYSGNRVTSEIERLIRPVLARTKKNGNSGENEKRYRRSFENYMRLADWGTDLVLSENNLNGLIVAARVAPLKQGVGDEIRAKCEQSLTALQMRKKMSRAELAKDSLDKCRKLIEPAWQKFQSENAYISQPDSTAVHTCLFGLLSAVSATEELADAAQEMTEQINLLRSHFEEIRFPSSTALLARAKKEIQNLEQELATAIDFDWLKEDVAALQKQIQQSGRVKRGVPGWMHEDHVAEALRETSELYQAILKKERSPAELESAMRLFEADIAKLDSPQASLTPNQIKRLQARVGNDSPLIKWLTACFKLPEERTPTWGRIEKAKIQLKVLWTRMESQQEQRAEEFKQQCIQFEAQIRESEELSRTRSELRELERSVTEFLPQKQPDLRKLLDNLAKAFRQRAADSSALRQLIKGILDDIAKAHRRIFAPIDFDELNSRAIKTKQWLNLGIFSDADRRLIAKEIGQCFAEIRRLRFRQEKAKAERQAKANELAAALQKEIVEVDAEASANPGSQESWHALADMDGRIRENWNFLTDSQRQALRQAVEAGFQKIKAARAAFAAEASKVFAQYNEILSDTLFALEEEASKEAAFEAIERIKPIRAGLRAERRLLKRQRDDLFALLSQISSSIDEVFDQANAKSAQEFNRIRAEMERFDDEIKKASNWQTANALFEKLKQLSAQIQATDLNIAARKECRAEIDRLFDDVKERLQAFRFTRTQTEDVDSMLARLERQGHLIFVRGVPRIT